MLVFIVMIALIGCESLTSNNNNGDSSELTPKKQVQELTESQKIIQKILSLIDEGKAFDTGSYIKEIYQQENMLL